MTAAQIGVAGEAAVAAAFLRCGVPVYLPVGDTGVDLIADFGSRPQRIQVKSSALPDDCISFQLGRRSGSRVIGPSGWRTYPTGLVDWFALYSLAHDTAVLIPADSVRSSARVLFVGDGATHRGKTTYNASEHELSAVTARV